MTATRYVAALAVTAVSLVISGLIRADSRTETSSKCSALRTANFAGIQDAPTQITDAKLVEEKETAAYCQVQGVVIPQVGFEIQLPISKWNGRLLKVGCGGMCGLLWTKRGVCEAPVRKGYACIVSDMGHTSPTNERTDAKGLWAYNNLQAEVDFAYRATHVATLAGKAITAHYYGTVPERSYYMGCSTGGRQGLVEAQRFPWDFDGIIAGAPAIDYTGTRMYHLWANFAAHGRNGDAALLPYEAVVLSRRAAIDRCDLDDGVKDGILGNPRACDFDPSELECKNPKKADCLSALQVKALKKIYAGVTTSTGERIYPGVSLGSELRILDPKSDYASFAKEFSTELFRYLSFVPDPGPTWKPADLNFDRDYKRFGMMQSLYAASNPDLRKFKAAGGKLIVYHGWNDEYEFPEVSIDYYETVERTMGGRKSTEDFFRLFMLPGVDHCWGGRGADAVDFLGALVAWRERGQAPDMVLSAHIDMEPRSHYPYREWPSDIVKARFTRPVYPYPKRAMYKGAGNHKDAENFLPVEP